MTDRVQTIKALQKIHTHFWIKFRGCGIKAEKAKYQERLSVIADAISLLKEQNTYDREQYQKGYKDRDDQIVRCRDCTHFHDMKCSYPVRGTCDLWHMLHWGDWYCADGKRKSVEDG